MNIFLQVVFKNKIKVLECIRQGQVGGGESHLLSLVENLDRNRFDPIVLSFTDGPMLERLKELGVEAHVIYTEKPFDISKWNLVKNFISKHKVDIVHAHGTRACSNIMWPAQKLKLPVVYSIHGWSFHQEQNKIVHKLRAWGESYLTSRANVNISVSLSNQETGKKYIKGFSSSVINNGIDQRKFSPEGKKQKETRRALGIDDNTLLILFVARFTLQKQPLTLIRAFKEALEDFPAMKLLMVGDGDQKEEARQLVEQFGVKDKVIFQPFRQDVPELLASADIFVLPSLWEGLPISLLEAMSMAKPVIATDVDGTKEIILNDVTGLLTEAGNVKSLREGLTKLCKDDLLRAKLGKAAAGVISERFNAANMTRQIETIYTNLVT